MTRKECKRLLNRTIGILSKIGVELDGEYQKLIQTRNTAKRTTDTLRLNANAAERMAAELEREVEKLGASKKHTGDSGPVSNSPVQHGLYTPPEAGEGQCKVDVGKE